MNKKLLMSMAFVLCATPSFAMDNGWTDNDALSRSSLSASVVDTDSDATTNALNTVVQDSAFFEEAARKNQSKGFFGSVKSGFWTVMSYVTFGWVSN